MTIKDLLKEQNARVSMGNSWLYFDKDMHKWIVRTQPRGKMASKVVNECEFEYEAVKALCELEGIEV